MTGHPSDTSSDDVHIGVASGKDARQVLDDLSVAVAADPAARAIEQDSNQRSVLLTRALRYRQSSGRTQKAVAGTMRTTQSAVSALESGRIDPQLGTLQRYARAIARRLDIGVVPTDLPVFADESTVLGLWHTMVHSTTAPLLKTLVVQNPPEARTVAALSAHLDTLPSLIQATLDGLIQTGWVRVHRTRKTTSYLVEPTRLRTVGVSLEHDGVTAVVTDPTKTNGDVHASPLRSTSNPEDVIVATAQAVRVLVERNTGNPILGVGVTLAGIVDVDLGVVRSAPDLDPAGPRSGEKTTTTPSTWAGFHFAARLREALDEVDSTRGLPVAVENDANALVINEYLAGGRVCPEVVLINQAGVGVGYMASGHVLRGVAGSSVMRGAHGAAGEGGHIIVRSDGPRCRAGLDHAGCLETVASPEGILRGLGRNPTSGKQFEEHLIEVDKILGNAQDGSRGVSQDARQTTAVVADAGCALGHFLGTSIRLFDPSHVAVYRSAHFAEHGTGAHIAAVFDEGVSTGLDESSASREELVGTPEVVWHDYDGEVGADAAAAAAMWQFLHQPFQWVPALLPEDLTRARELQAG